MKKISAILIATALTLSLFTSCVARRPEKTISNNPPRASVEEQATKKIAIEETNAEPVTDKEEQTTENRTVEETYAEKVVPSTKRLQEHKSDRNYNYSDKAERKTEHKAEKSALHTNRNTKPDPATDVNIISADKVKKSVLAHANLGEADIKYYHSELDRERRTLVYEIEFVSGKYEYDYEVNAGTGEIIKTERELRD